MSHVILLLILFVQTTCGSNKSVGHLGYHKHREMVKFLKEYAQSHPKQTHLYSIGKSLEGKDLWVMAVADHSPDIHISKRPEIAFIANMHGDEPVGREMMLYLLDYLLNDNGIDKRVQKIMSTSRLHIMPCMNPDGFERAHEGVCGETSMKQESMTTNDNPDGRGNARKEDLNRRFPDYFDHEINRDSLCDETRAVMKWMDEVPFVLATNFHGGVLVANYPFDTEDEDNKNMALRRVAAPDDDILKHVASVYAQNHGQMATSKCDGYRKFPGGITNGADWYSIAGSLQDYQYAFKGILSTTMEISCCKYPIGDDLDSFWKSNKNAMLEYILQANRGVRGFIFDPQGNGIHANLQIKGRNMTFNSTADGEYYRILLPGTYTLIVKHDSFQTKNVKFTISDDKLLLELDVRMDNNEIPIYNHTESKSKPFSNDRDFYSKDLEKVKLIDVVKRSAKVAEKKLRT